MNIQYMMGEAAKTTPSATDVMLAFHAAPVGLAVIASDMRPVNYDDIMTREQVMEAYRRWWDYWRVYWRVRGTAEALPYDSTCEITLPMKGA
jgi:hypothetical protein